MVGLTINSGYLIATILKDYAIQERMNVDHMYDVFSIQYHEKLILFASFYASVTNHLNFVTKRKYFMFTFYIFIKREM